MFSNTLIKSVTFLVAAACLGGAPASTAHAGDSLQEQIDRAAMTFVRRKELNGYVQVTRRGEVLFSKAYGTANLATGEKNSAETRFLMASVTKPFTAVLTLQQIERGNLHLEDRISSWIPNPPRSWSEITIRNLLTHTGGIVDFLNTPELLEPLRKLNRRVTPDEILARFKNLPLIFKPGTLLKYSNSGYFLLAYILEKSTGKTYQALIQEGILGPLGMTHSGIKTTTEFPSGFAAPYLVSNGTVQPAPMMDPSILFGLGNLFTTPEDLHKFDQALYSDQLLTRETREQMFTPNFDRYGFGFSLRKPNGYRLAFHEGHVSGFSHRIARYLDEEITILIFNNLRQVKPDELSDQIAGILYGKPMPTPFRAPMI